MLYFKSIFYNANLQSYVYDRQKCLLSYVE